MRTEAIAVAAGSILATVALAGVPASFADANPIDHLRSLRAQVHAAISPGRRDALIDTARASLISTYGLDPKSRRLIGNRPVHIDPWEIGVAWAYGLNWKPLPVFQDQQAYTAALQQQNVDALNSPHGPQRILRENNAVVDPTYPTGAIDGDLGSFDPPEASVAMLCNFKAVRTTQRWQVLDRTQNRCGPGHTIQSLNARLGETVAVPHAGPGQLLIARIHGAEVKGLETLRSFLYRPYGRVIGVDGTTYGLNPGTAASGLLLRAPAKLDFPAPFALAPEAEHIAVATLSGSTAPLTIDFVAIPIKAADVKR